SWGVSSSKGAPCPGGPVAQREAEGSTEEEEEEEEEEEGETEQGARAPCSPLCVTEPGRDPAEPEPPTQPNPDVEPTPPDPASADGSSSAWVPAGNCPVSLQGPGGPHRAEEPSSSRDPHADPGWLTELLALWSPVTTCPVSPVFPQDLLGWSRKDLRSEFGIDRAHQAGVFDWSREAVAKERDWPGETEQDRAFGTTLRWDSPRSARDGAQPDGPFCAAGRDWGSGYGGTEPMGQARLGCSDWPQAHSAGQSCQRDREFGAGKPEWSTRYSAGSGDIGTAQADWSVGHHRQQEKEPSWAGRYGPDNPESRDGETGPPWSGERGTSGAEVKDEELTSNWASQYSSRDAETKDFTLGWAGRSSTGDTGSPEKEFSPSRPGWDSQYSTRDMENQDREFSPSRPAWTGEHSTRDMESQDQEFSPSRPAWTGEHSTRDMESQDQEFSPSRPAWDSRHSMRDVETRDREFKPSQPTWSDEHSTRDSGDGEVGPGRLSWGGECGIGQTELGDAFGVQDNLLGSPVPDPLAQEPVWGSTHWQGRGAIESRDWTEELGGSQRHDQFGVIGTERVPDPSSSGASGGGSVCWAGGRVAGGRQEPLGDWHRDLPFGTSSVTGQLGTSDVGGVGLGQAWGEVLGSEARVEELGWSSDLGATDGSDAEAKRREWASAFGARCASRSRDFGTRERSLGGDADSADGSVRLPDPSLPMGAAPAAEPPQSETPSPTEEERDDPESPLSPGASAPPPGAASTTLPDTESEGAPSDHPDGGRPPSWEEKRLSLGAPQPEGLTDPPGLEFTFLEDTEVLDSSVYRSKASLGRKRRHRAPALRPVATAEGDAWIFRDSTEPRPTRPAASDEDEEAVEEPKSRRVRSSPLGKGMKVPLFPGLSTAALKAKLRGRNRSAEEGATPGDGKGASAKDSHVQRSKSCKIPGLSGKAPALPPKPDKSSG
ncbi:TB182 protein, partial [Todus mexicanus]|nr:TB182 protein [Todus mexicanus]